MPGTLRLAVVVVAGCSAWAMELTAAQVEGCPTPIVAVRNRVEGADKNRSVQLNRPLAGSGGLLNEWALGRIIEANRGEIRFVETIRSGMDSDFVLTLNETVVDTAARSTLTLADQKGRAVLGDHSVSFTRGELDGEVFDALVERLVAPVVPLLPVLRSYQRDVRERERSAIYALARMTPLTSTIAPDEAREVTVSLVDCDSGNPPLAGREVLLHLDGVGGLDRARLVTDSEGQGTVRFRSHDRGSADITPEWSYENTVGTRTVADAEIAVIRVGSPVGFTRMSVNPRFQPQSDEDAWYLGEVWVLADEQVELHYPAGALSRARPARSAVCDASFEAGAGGREIRRGAEGRWGPEGRSGSQQARSQIVASFESESVVRLQITLESHGRPESAWDEEDGSEIWANAVLDWVVDIRDPEKIGYVLSLFPETLRASSSGMAEYDAHLSVEARGCTGRHNLPWSANLSGSDGRRVNRGGRGASVTIEGDPHVQVVLSLSIRVSANGGKMEAPFHGDGEFVLDLELRIEPLER